MSSALMRTPSGGSQIQQMNSSQTSAVAQTSSQTKAQNGNTTPAQQQTPSNVRTPQQMLERPSNTTLTPGKWEHPRMAEILKRQHLTTFDGTNVTRIIISVFLILSLWTIPHVLRQTVLASILLSLPNGAGLISYALQSLLFVNITVACMPLIRGKDNMEDIPLTPQQRRLLDLPPMSRAATPQEEAAYVTPPRYSRNNTPTSLDSLKVNARGTPLSARGSPRDLLSSSSTPASLTRVGSGSIYNGSPLGRLPEPGRRDSSASGRGSPLAIEKDYFGSPANKRASTGLNNKWLYDRSKPSAVTPSGILGAGWGSGSVFN